ncbi:MAG: hydroxyacid dehydrogenase [Chloroflexi bacterium]|nr:hydroxyacid dehydrogenase [Chloroflexota bacterium]
MIYKIAVIDDYLNITKDLIDWSEIPNSKVDFYNDTLSNKNQFIQRLLPYNIIVIIRERSKFPKDVLENLPNLSLIAASGTGLANIDLLSAKKNNIHITTTKGIRSSSGESTAEITWSLILALSKQLVVHHNNFLHGKWQSEKIDELYGKKIGILGLGRIGLKVAKIAKIFGMETIGWSRTIDQKRADINKIKLVAKDQLLSDSDYLSVHLKLTEETINFIRLRELEKMKKSAFIVNTARGPIVNENDLIYALENKIISGAGLDVFEVEPLPKEHKFVQLNNVILSPHLGYATVTNIKEYMEISKNNIISWLNNQ